MMLLLIVDSCLFSHLLAVTLCPFHSHNLYVGILEMDEAISRDNSKEGEKDKMEEASGYNIDV